MEGQIASLKARRLRPRGPTGHFLQHLIEMCLAMCLGMAVLDVPYFGIARVFGYSDPFRQIPELSALVVAFNMSAPMVAWMRHRGMDWRSTLEMSGAMFVEAFVLIAVAWLGVISKSSLVLAWQHPLMVPAMVAVMLYHRDVYTGRVGHQAHPA